jgi:RNA polymerase sigma-70 factor (ECF subfamily)
VRVWHEPYARKRKENCRQYDISIFHGLVPFIVLGFSGFNSFRLYKLVSVDDCFPSYKRMPERALQKFLTFFAACFSPVLLVHGINVNAGAGNDDARSDFFPSTHWSVVLAAGKSQAEPTVAQAALAELCQSYWTPLYSFVRSRGYSVHDAQDLTQSFFAYLIEHKIYARVDPEKGRFRSFLLASMKNFLGHASERERTLKRGGGQNLLPLDEEQMRDAESLFQTQRGTSSEDHLFDRSWAEALLALGFERLSADYKGESREKLFNELSVFLTSGSNPLPTYTELASRLGITESTLRSHVTRLRARYREVLRAEVRRTVDTESEVDEELHELLRVLTVA